MFAQQTVSSLHIVHLKDTELYSEDGMFGGQPVESKPRQLLKVDPLNVAHFRP